MNTTEAVLVVLIILLIILVMAANSPMIATRFKKTRNYDCVAREDGKAVHVQVNHIDEARNNIEAMYNDESREYYSQDTAKNDGLGSTGFKSAGDAVEAAGYNEYIKKTNLGPDMFESHQRWLGDYLTNLQYKKTGFTSRDTIREPPQEVTWLGLRRPSYVEIGNPTRMPDIERGFFNEKPKISWVG